jgi:hypothetical protein
LRTNAIYIILLVVALGAIGLFLTSEKKKKFDDRVTLRRQDKLPYGTFVSFKNLDQLFPNARIYSSRHEPGYWDSINLNDEGQAYIAVTDRFNADNYEMKQLLSFAENGNDVFISAITISDEAADIITSGMKKGSFLYSTSSPDYYDDSLEIHILKPVFSTYIYPGKNYSGYFSHINENTTEIIGTDADGHPNFIHLKAGKGNFYMHLAPIAFSNYFLLHRQNIDYYEKALSVIPKTVKKVVWDDYYLRKRSNDYPREKKTSWLTVLFRYPGFKAALLVAIFTLLIYVIAEMRRKQRYIPVVTKPRNDSLDFVKTIGRLYYEKGNHSNLARKMTAYFFEYVRSNYKLHTGTLDDTFVKNLNAKSGVAEKEIRDIITLIRYTEDSPALSDRELNDFYRQLERFYKQT